MVAIVSCGGFMDLVVDEESLEEEDVNDDDKIEEELCV